MTKRISIKFLAMAVLCVLLSISNVFAQSQASTGQITGVVSDLTGAVVPNATVTLTNKNTNQTQEATSSDDGVYRFVLLQPGNYSVKSASSGFGEQILDVEVQVGRTTDANFTLGAAGTTATVEVTAEGVQTTASQFDAVQNQTAIDNLPINGRRFQDFVTLTPGAQVGLGGDTRGQISLSGQRGINSNINVDGVDFNQPFFGGIRGGERSNSAFSIPQESIREFQVIAAGYSAEFGRSTGGIVNAVTKTGTNGLRGSLFYLLRPRQLARANEYAKALQEQRLSQIVVNGQMGVDATLAPTQQQFGGSIGGPIVKDKLFYFASYEQQRFRAPRQTLFGNLVGLTPANAGQTEVFNFYRSQETPFTQTNDVYAGLGRIDYNFNDANRFNVRYNYSRNDALNGAATGETSFDPTTNNALSTNGTEGDRNQSVVAQFVSNFSASFLNEARFQFANEKRPRIANELIPNVATGIGTFGTRSFLPTTQKDRRIQFTDSLTVLSGNHTFKFGGEFSNIFADQSFGFNQFGAYALFGQSTINTLEFVSANRVPGRLGRFDSSGATYRQQIGDLQAAYNVQELSFFAQDSWRVTPKFTLNYGLRFEKQYNPEPEANNQPLIDVVKNAAFPIRGGKGFDATQIADSKNQFGPRVGFAYDPAGDGKTVIRAFAGIYHARTPLLLLAGPFNNFRNPAGDLSVTLGPTFFNSSTFNQATFDAANPQYTAIVGGTGITPNTVYRQFAILGINLNTTPIGNLPTLTPQQLQTIQQRIQAARTAPASSLGFFFGSQPIGLDENFRNPESYQFGGGVEREIAQDIVVGLDFSWVKTVYLQRNREVNIPGPTTFDATTGRPNVNRNLRPAQDLGSFQIRESSAKSLYRSATVRIRLNKKWGQVNAFYTLSKSDSDDDNERDSGGVGYSNPYDLSSEYGPSRIDRTHQFVASPVFFLPYGFEVSSAIRLRSGTPVNVIVNSDLNGDGVNNDRPYLVPGVQIERNAYRNRSIYDVDLRVQKGFRFGERRRLIFSTEFFNIFNLSNIQIGSTTTTSFCATGTGAAPISRCGLDGPSNINFLQVREQNQSSPNFGKIIVANNPGSQVFQMQLGARFQF